VRVSLRITFEGKREREGEGTGLSSGQRHPRGIAFLPCVGACTYTRARAHEKKEIDMYARAHTICADSL